MGAAHSPRVLAGLALAAGLSGLLAACGPAHLSALGNPGDLCTESTACVEGTECRITEQGYRCVGRDGRVPEPRPGFTAAGGEADPGADEDVDDEAPPRSRSGGD